MKIEYHGGENLKKFIVEFGMGTDFHGQDVTKAAKKAVKDAVSRSCLCGLEDVLGLTDFKRQVRDTRDGRGLAAGGGGLCRGGGGAAGGHGGGESGKGRTRGRRAVHRGLRRQGLQH